MVIQSIQNNGGVHPKRQKRGAVGGQVPRRVCAFELPKEDNMISIQNVSKNYKKVKALDNFCYQFDHGIYAILGPNGSGKTTLMNIMTNNISPDSGEIMFSDHRRISEVGDNEIGYVPQYSGMYPNFSVYEMLDYIAILKKAENREDQIKELMAAFDLEEYARRPVRALSGGTRQRLAIAQGLIGHPDLLILDEPTAGLDPVQRIAFKNYIAAGKDKMTVIISTHIVSDVEEIADEVIFLKKGVIVRSGKLQSITGTLAGKCWGIKSAEKLAAGQLYRVFGNEIRVVSETKPCPDAFPVEPTLEECYLEVFGMGEDHEAV